jgi:hypothetical protein
MRDLIEGRALGMLDDIYYNNNISAIEYILDLEIGIWNAYDDPPMSQKLYSRLVENLDDDELLELYDYLMYEINKL